MFGAHLKKSIKAHPALNLVILGACGGFSSYTAKVTEGVLEQSQFINSFSIGKGIETALSVSTGATLGGTLAQWAIQHRRSQELAQFAAGATGDSAVTLISAGLEAIRGRKQSLNAIFYNVVVSAMAGGSRNLAIFKARQMFAKMTKEADKHSLMGNDKVVAWVLGFIGGTAAGVVRTALTGGSAKQLPINSFRSGFCVAASALAQKVVSDQLK
eukprot:gnl/Chilomastix_caulleri/500.p1 GENE.gnl/Chilomastix_caulleri/500~~gnl/Chilomastix_caulleri/500.p1  ORF type:complete len:214 (+),score=21.80 gnl/Chilomastix_caulleri/500:60-701(+)